MHLEAEFIEQLPNPFTQGQVVKFKEHLFWANHRCNNVLCKIKDPSFGDPIEELEEVKNKLQKISEMFCQAYPEPILINPVF